MKFTLPTPIKAVIAVVALTGFVSAGFLFSGCSTGPLSNTPTGFDRAVDTIQTNVTITNVTVIQTNVTVTTLTTTNIVAGQPQVITNIFASTNFVPVVVPVPITNYVYSVSPTTTDTVNGIGATLSAFGVPGGSLIGTIALGLLGMLASFKNKQYGTTMTQLTSVIQGVESGLANQTPAIATAVKGAIQASATAAGVQPSLHAIVQANT